MNIPVAFYRIMATPPAPLGPFSGFVVGGNASQKTNTNQSIITAALNPLTVPKFSVYFGGQPYFTTPQQVSGIAYDLVNSIWVICSASTTKTPYSLNGSTWLNTIDAPSSGPNNVTYGLVGGGGGLSGFVLTCNTSISYLRSSLIASGWQTATVPDIQLLFMTHYSVGVWVAAGLRNGSTVADIYYSSDGSQTYQEVAGNASFTSGARCVTSGIWHNSGVPGFAWVVGGADSTNNIRYSPNLAASGGWIEDTGPGISQINAIATDGGAHWVVCGPQVITPASNNVWYSNDYGATWSEADLAGYTPPTGSLFQASSVTFGSLNGTPTWIMTGGANTDVKTMYSIDNGATWHAPSFDATTTDLKGDFGSGGNVALYVP